MATRRRTVLGAVAVAAILAPLGLMRQQSLLPSSYSVTDMGYPDTGGGTLHRHTVGAVSVVDLVETSDRQPDVAVDLVAAQGRFELASGREVDGYTVNGTSPGPAIVATVGDLVQVRITNKDVADGITLHWHGVDVPNAEDGVAGVTQDAVGVGEQYTYRFIANHVGTYWYHSHQVSHEQVVGGLLGSLVVLPRGGVPQPVDVVGLAHTYDGHRTLNGSEGDIRLGARTGQTVRVRVINTDNATLQVWSSGPFRVVAIDGWDLNEPPPVTGRRLSVAAGGRADLEVVAPARVQVGATTAFAIGATAPLSVPQPPDYVNLTEYGEPAPLPFDATKPDRRFDYVIDRRLGFLDGRPGMWWTVNGHLYPDTPMYVVDEGDVFIFRIYNASDVVHPMHLHGHHGVVLSHNQQPVTGGPIWVDSLDVEPGESYELGLIADNPGIWLDHCHNLPHATQGMIAHLMYAGVTTPYLIGGTSENHPE